MTTREQRIEKYHADRSVYQAVPKSESLSRTAKDRKLCTSLEEAIKRSGLKDGMTVSFHHAFRGGDFVVNMVMNKIAEMGFKNLTLASSSLIDSHFPIVEHIKNGVVTKIYSSGLRGELAEQISRGLLNEPVNIHSHGGRVHLVKSGELKIDVAFLGVPCCDTFGNANGFTGKSKCGSLGYARVDAEYADKVVLLTEEFVEYPHHPISIAQDQVDLIVQVEAVGDPKKNWWWCNPNDYQSTRITHCA